ncbi:MAG: flagellar export chaperone FliS [Oscillospiraceae bacterium]|jgi:flagellar protein FliS|nr:flagellar export chaperone FliS [Oscillospiraceae bacterium]
MPNPYISYKQQAVSTMTPIEIVVKIYDECERQLNRAVYFINVKDIEKAHAALDKSGELINALRSVLDMSVGEISENLDALYEYFFRRIVHADMRKDADAILKILPLIGELKDAFVQISKLPKHAVGVGMGSVSASAAAVG